MNELDKMSSSSDDVIRPGVSDTPVDPVSSEAPAAGEDKKNNVAEYVSVTAVTVDDSGIHLLAVEPAAENAAPALLKPEDMSRAYHAMDKPQLLESLKAILESGNLEAHKEVALIKQVFYTIHNREITSQMEAFIAEGNLPEDFSSTPDECEAEMKNLLSEFREKRNAFLEQKEEERRANLEQKRTIIADLKTIAEDIDNINLHYSRFQQLQQDFKNVGEVPAGYDNDIWKEYQAAVEQFYDRLKMNKELRDLDFKKNLELKTILVEKARELSELADPVEAFRRLQVLHDQFREIGPVAREMREEIWNNFKEASTVVNKRHQDFFQARKAAEQENEDAKIALCEKAEAIDFSSFKTFSEWDNATKEFL
ncbi:MAG: DUF349 domain-containing protein, partial [Muribaculaceae bacterium]|nr:DUF349 domain-containing protein [Muribaculaceae bacterium]